MSTITQTGNPNNSITIPALILANDFAPIIKIDLLQNNTSNKDQTWVYENFEIIQKNATDEYEFDDVSNCIVSFFSDTKEIIVRFKVESGKNKSNDDDGFIRFITKGITLKTKEKIQIEYGQYFALRLSLEGIEEDAYIDFYADDDGEGFLDEKGKQNLFSGRLLVKESDLKPGLFISFIEGGSEINHKYVYGANYEGQIPFVKNVYTALNHIIEKKADVTNVIKKVAENENIIVRIKKQNSNDTGKFNYSSIVVNFNPYTAVELFSGGRWSPAQILLHELAHALSYSENAEQHRLDSVVLPRIGSREERDVIENVDNPAAKILGRPIRITHTGDIFYQTISPISIEKKSK